MAQPMSFQINRGLFRLDFIDNHAILGVPVNAEFNEIRKRYLKIARRLHPDSCKADTEEEKLLAKDIFAKLVSPAYTKFSNEHERAEYSVLLGLMGKRCLQDKSKIQLQSDGAKQLSQANDFEKLYKTFLSNLAGDQYQSLSQTLDIIAQISELNMVYLMRQESKGGISLPSSSAPPAPPPTNRPPATSASPTPTAGPKPTPPPPPPPTASKTDSRLDGYYRRAEEWMSKNNLAQAILELRDALKIDPNSSRCHALLGMVYLKQKQVTMAKVHITKALQLNPQEQVALDAKKKLDKPASTGKPKQSGGGMFGGLFGGGGKKK